MKKLIFLATVTLLSACQQQTDVKEEQTINPIIGDISFVNKFGVQPDQTTEESLRIRTHLEYVEQLLRQKDVSNLPAVLQEKRAKLLNLLHNYQIAGNFPKNYDFKEQRKPCFIDKDGNICAVGYLVEQTEGRAVAEKINSLFKYSEIYDMEQPALTGWIASSGLTRKECAMIQPTYNYDPPRYPYYHNHGYIEPVYGFSSAMLSGANISLITLNSMQISRPGQSGAIPILGLIAGTGQVAMGAIKLYQDDRYTYRGPNESQKALSFINIGLGTSAMILSSCNLFSKSQQKKDPTTAWNFYSYPTAADQVGVGLTFTKQF